MLELQIPPTSPKPLLFTPYPRDGLARPLQRRRSRRGRACPSRNCCPKPARLTIFAGLQGSGKTSIAVSYALYLRQMLSSATPAPPIPLTRVILADLDIVNPYYRSADFAAKLEERGVELIASKYARTNLDAPAHPSVALTLFDDQALYGVIDLGGDARGALALGRYREHIADEQNKAVLLVINPYRPFTQTPKDALAVKNEIEQAAGFSFTGIVGNPNIGRETTAQNIITANDTLRRIAQTLELPIVMTAADRNLKTQAEELKIENLFFIEPYKPPL